MAVNPIQKKSRNAFLLGVIITLIICLIAGGLVYFFISTQNKQKEIQRGNEKKAYVLNQDVKSGQEIKSNYLTEINVYSNMIPSNYLDASKFLEIQTKEGTNTPMVAKIDLSKNSILTSNAIAKSDEVLTNDTRYVEYNMITLQTTAQVGDYIDIRLSLPNGQDFLVISKTKIENLQDSTIGLHLSEEEILMMNSAMVEAYIMTASNFYAIQYIEPGNQEGAKVTYTPTTEVRNLIAWDANIVSTARESLEARFSDGVRSFINSATGLYESQSLSNIESGVQKQIESAKTARENYLKSISAPATTTTNN